MATLEIKGASKPETTAAELTDAQKIAEMRELVKSGDMDLADYRKAYQDKFGVATTLPDDLICLAAYNSDDDDPDLWAEEMRKLEARAQSEAHHGVVSADKPVNSVSVRDTLIETAHKAVAKAIGSAELNAELHTLANIEHKKRRGPVITLMYLEAFFATRDENNEIVNFEVDAWPLIGSVAPEGCNNPGDYETVYWKAENGKVRKTDWYDEAAKQFPDGANAWQHLTYLDNVSEENGLAYGPYASLAKNKEVIKRYRQTWSKRFSAVAGTLRRARHIRQIMMEITAHFPKLEYGYLTETNKETGEKQVAGTDDILYVQPTGKGGGADIKFYSVGEFLRLKPGEAKISDPKLGLTIGDLNATGSKAPSGQTKQEKTVAKATEFPVIDTFMRFENGLSMLNLYVDPDNKSARDKLMSEVMKRAKQKDGGKEFVTALVETSDALGALADLVRDQYIAEQTKTGTNG